MAIVKCSEHVDEVESRLRHGQTDPFDFLRATFAFALDVVVLVEGVHGLDEVAEAASGVVVRNQVEVILRLIINDLMQPYYIRMLQPLEHLQLLSHAIVCTFCVTAWLS